MKQRRPVGSRGAFGLFGVILKSVTIDGWVVIAILGVMSVVSWYVMITKYFYVAHVEKGNALFLKEWRKMSKDLTALDHTDTIGPRALPAAPPPRRRSSSPTPRSTASTTSGRRRLGIASATAAETCSPRAPSRRSARASTAVMCARITRSTTAWSFLTISIAGGTVHGLLGTVVGVMITFAAIAATGEVNIRRHRAGSGGGAGGHGRGAARRDPGAAGLQLPRLAHENGDERHADLHRRVRHQDGRYYSNSEVDVAHH